MIDNGDDDDDDDDDSNEYRWLFPPIKKGSPTRM